MKRITHLPDLLALCGLSLLTLLLHGSALSGYWRFDDGWLLDYADRYSPWEYFFDPLITRGYSTSNVTPWNPFLYDLNMALFGLEPAAFYWHHLSILAAAAIAGYLLLRLWMRPVFALVGASAFLLGAPTVHIAQKLMVGHYLEGLLFAMLGLYFFILALRKRRASLAAVGCGFYVLATTCKEVYVPLPGVLLFFREGDLGTRLRYGLPYFAWSLLYLGWRQQVLGRLIGGYQAGGRTFEPLVALEQIAAIPGMLFGDPVWGLVAICLLGASLTWAWLAGNLNPGLAAASLAMVLLPLLPLTVTPGISGPDRYLFLPWWLISMTMAVTVAGMPKPGVAMRLLLGCGVLVIVGIQAHRTEHALEPKLTMYDRTYRFALTAPAGQVLLLDQVKDAFYLDVVLNGARDVQSRRRGKPDGRLNILVHEESLELIDTERYSVWSYQEGCRCVRDVSDEVGNTEFTPRAMPVRDLRIHSLAPPYPALFEGSEGNVDGLELHGSQLMVHGWTGLHDTEPEQELILIAPGQPVQPRSFVVERPDVVRIKQNHHLRYSGFRLLMDYPDKQMAREASEDLCILERSALSPVRVLNHSEHPHCAGLHSDRPLGR